MLYFRFGFKNSDVNISNISTCFCHCLSFHSRFLCLFTHVVFLTDQSKYSDLNQKDNQTDVQEGLKKQT